MRNKIISMLTISTVFVVFFTITVNANSSWHWVTTSPKTILPIAIIITLLIETFGVLKMNCITNAKRVFLIICLANILSFVSPYIERAYRFIPTSGGFSISAAFNKGPYYIVLAGYLMLTLIIEIPVVYLLLKKYVKSKKRLISSILCTNIITTILVAIGERILCIGRW